MPARASSLPVAAACHTVSCRCWPCASNPQLTLTARPPGTLRPARSYMDAHTRIAARIGKPLLLEEFSVLLGCVRVRTAV